MRSNRLRSDQYRRFLVVVAGLAAITTGVHAMAAEPLETLATSAANPVALGAGPLAVTLAAAANVASLSARVATVRQNRKMYLVAKGLGTNEQPGVVYQIYLALPQGVAPKPDGPYYVGSLNFFNATSGGAEPARPDPRFYSFDVTDLLKDLQSRKSLGDTVTVTIVPADKPRASARPMIAEIALVEQ
jgi:tyrosinase